ncbi:unnamed protein product [Polarella glacialis]|uniref:Uncharacterized protein n=1 Tax=Polarella glacialis TaxID=89957 RepID=A0A813HX75_POLGL|nr:unnamed protein product [Polarella glacialis]
MSDWNTTEAQSVGKFVPTMTLRDITCATEPERSCAQEVLQRAWTFTGQHTHTPTGNGPTYTGPRGERTRVDYLAIPTSLLSAVKRAMVWYSTAYFLQLARTATDRDHAPVVLDFEYRSWFQDTNSSTRFNTEAMMTALPADIEKFQTNFDQLLYGVCEAIQDEVSSTAAVDQLWHVLNFSLQAQLQLSFPAVPFQRFSYTAQTRELAQQYYGFRRQMAQHFLEHRRMVPAPLLEQQHEMMAELAKERRHEHRAHRASLIEALHQASFTGNSRHVWRLARVLASTHHGPRSRHYGHVSRSQPTVWEWLQ